MTNTQRKRPRLGRKPGRPRVAKQPEQDGARLRDALAAFGWSQAEVQARTGIPQFTLSQIIAGNRSLGRENLRALATIGIPANYLLGLEKRLVAVGETREVAVLERDLASRLIRETINAATVPEPWIRTALASVIDGKAVLAEILRLVQNDVLSMAEYCRRTRTLTSEVISTFDATDMGSLAATLIALRPALLPPTTTLIAFSMGSHSWATAWVAIQREGDPKLRFLAHDPSNSPSKSAREEVAIPRSRKSRSPRRKP